MEDGWKNDRWEVTGEKKKKKKMRVGVEYNNNSPAVAKKHSDLNISQTYLVDILFYYYYCLFIFLLFLTRR